MNDYEVGVNNLAEDKDYCMYCDKQYTIKIKADNEEEAKEKAVKRILEEFKDMLVTDNLEVACIKNKSDSNE